MDFDLTETQQEILGGSAAILRRMAGPARARELGGIGGYDHDLEAALADNGYLGLALEEEAGALEATLVVEQVAAALGAVSVGARALVAPALEVTLPAGPVALLPDVGFHPVRFGGAGTTIALARADGQAWLCQVTADPLPTRWGYAVGRVRVDERQPLGPDSEDVLMRWWCVATAAELVGTMDAALTSVVQYVKDRVQFGRPLASLQAVQHRLAEALVRVEGSRWLSYHAAWAGAPAREATAAATHAATTGRMLVRGLHQLCGAIGLTEEFDLHLWTMRIRALYLEVDGCALSETTGIARSAG